MNMKRRLLISGAGVLASILVVAGVAGAAAVTTSVPCSITSNTLTCPLPPPETVTVTATSTVTVTPTSTATTTPAAPHPQTLGVGGVATPSGAILGQGSAGSPLNITTSGTASAPRVYDGQGRTVGTITVSASYVTVQNYNISAGSQYGAYLDGDHITFQNNDIKNVVLSGSGDLNAITVFGNNMNILYNTAINFVTGNPGTSHTDFVQTWVSTSHPVASSHWAIVGNKATGPANPSRSSSIASIHQCVMAQDANTPGSPGGGDTSGMSDWFIADNTFGDSWNQCIKLDGIDNVDITRNNFIGSSDHACQFASGTAQRFWSANTVGSGYGNVGCPVTAGNGPPTPVYASGP